MGVIMDFIKKLLQLIEECELEEINNQFSKFRHIMDDELEEKILTMSTTEEGYMIMSIFTPEQWEMALYISEVSGKDIQTVVTELSSDGDIATITIDPTEF